MKTHKIAVIAGDGIGPEVLAEGVRVLKQVAECDGGFSFEFTYFPWMKSVNILRMPASKPKSMAV